MYRLYNYEKKILVIDHITIDSNGATIYIAIYCAISQDNQLSIKKHQVNALRVISFARRVSMLIYKILLNCEYLVVIK